MAPGDIKMVGLKRVVQFSPLVTDVIVASILCLYALGIMVDVCIDGSI
jgi:hypothetical protein